MIRYLIAILAMVPALVCGAQEVKIAPLADYRSQLASMLRFEKSSAGKAPGGWGGGPSGTIFVDDEIVHTGPHAVRLERHPDSDAGFSSLTLTVPIDFTGAKLELRGFLRTEEVSGFAGFWMREDGDTRGVAFDNMQGR